MTDMASIALSIADPLTTRLLKDALHALGFRCSTQDYKAVLSDGSASADQLAAWNRMGTTVIVFRTPAPGSKMRLGAIMSILKRSLEDSRAASGLIAFGPFTLDLSQLTLTDTRDGSTAVLTEKERDILDRLHREGGGALDRRTLLQDVWGYVAQVETHTLETHIYRLRQKIENDPSTPVFLVTEGTGYSLTL